MKFRTRFSREFRACFSQNGQKPKAATGENTDEFYSETAGQRQVRTLNREYRSVTIYYIVSGITGYISSTLVNFSRQPSSVIRVRLAQSSRPGECICSSLRLKDTSNTLPKRIVRQIYFGAPYNYGIEGSQCPLGKKYPTHTLWLQSQQLVFLGEPSTTSRTIH